MTALRLLSPALVAAAPNFAVLTSGRASLGIGIAMIMRLVPQSEAPLALVFNLCGQAIAAAFAAPIGSYLDGIVGWCQVFWALTPIVAVNLIWHVIALPSLPAHQRQNFRAMIDLLKRPYFMRGLIPCMLSWSSAFTMFTHLRPFLEQVTWVDVPTLVYEFRGHIGAGSFLKESVAPFLKLPALVMGGHDRPASVRVVFDRRRPVHDNLGAMNTMFSVILDNMDVAERR